MMWNIYFLVLTIGIIYSAITKKSWLSLLALLPILAYYIIHSTSLFDFLTESEKSILVNSFTILTILLIVLFIYLLYIRKFKKRKSI
jgi:hypothetical protein